MRRWYLLMLLLATLLVNSLSLASARGEPITLSLVVPGFFMQASGDAFTQVIRDFEAANPGVQVAVVASDQQYMMPPTFGPPPAFDGLAQHLDALQTYVSRGDVLYVNPTFVTPEAVRAG